MMPSRLTQQQSSSSSGIFFKGDSHLSSSFANSSNSIPGVKRPNPNNNNHSSSVGASSLVTDANSSGGGPRLQRSASINNAAESSSYLCLPASPMSFSSNNMSVDGSSSVVQQHDPSPAGPAGAGASSATSGLPGPRMMYLPEPQQQPMPMSMPMQKKQRVEMMKQEDIMPHQMFQQILQRPDSSMQFQGARSNPQVQALLQQQQQRLRQQQQQQQQILHSMPQLQRAHMQQQQQQQHHLQQQQQMQMRQQQGVPQPVMAAAVKRPIDGGVCTRRLMQYLYHQRQRPQDNAIAYWRKFVAEYYSPRAKKRWCLSLYENVGNHALGVFPQASMDAWQCELCGSKSGKGFEATAEVLPRLNEIKFGSGVIDELLFLDLPREYRFPSGIMMLEYSKAVQESVYEQLRVVREGQLRIIFSQDLKILCWEFCARRHEELLPRRVVAPQVNQLVQVAQKCQSTITESGSDGVSQQDLQTNSNMVISAGRQLAKSMELQSLNDLGFSKRYVRCLQISEVVNSMKDLIDFCREHKAGPIDGLKNYPRHNSAAAKLQMEQVANSRGILTDPNTLNKLMGLSPAMNNQMPNNSSIPNNNNNHLMANRGGALSGPAQAALSLTNFQNHLHMRQNSMNSNPNSSLHQQQLQQPQDASPSFNNLNQSPSLGGYSTPQPYSRSMSANSSMMQQDHAQGGGSQLQQQQMIQQLLQEISSNSPANSAAAAAAAGGGGGGGGIHQHSLSGSGPRNGMSFGDGGVPPSRSNSFKAASNSDSSAAVPSGGGGNNGFHQRVGPDLGPNLHLQEELAQDLAQEFSDSGFFSGDLDDGVGFFQNGRRE